MSFGLGIGIGLGRQRAGGAFALPDVTTFDGTSQYLHGTSMTGGATGTGLSFYVAIDPASGAAGDYLARWGGTTGANGNYMRLNAAGALRLALRNSAGTTLLDTTKGPDLRGDPGDLGVWEIFGDWTDSAGAYRLHIAGTDYTATGTAGTARIDGSEFAVCAFQNSTANTFAGGMSRLCVWPNVALDTTDAAVRSQMRQPLLASSLGNNMLDFYTPSISSGTNEGTGSDLTAYGF